MVMKTLRKPCEEKSISTAKKILSTLLVDHTWPMPFLLYAFCQQFIKICMSGSKSFLEAHFNYLFHIGLTVEFDFHFYFCPVGRFVKYDFPMHTGKFCIDLAIFIAEGIKSGIRFIGSNGFIISPAILTGTIRPFHVIKPGAAFAEIH